MHLNSKGFASLSQSNIKSQGKKQLRKHSVHSFLKLQSLNQLLQEMPGVLIKNAQTY